MATAPWIAKAAATEGTRVLSHTCEKQDKTAKGNETKRNVTKREVNSLEKRISEISDVEERSEQSHLGLSTWVE